MDSGPCTDQAWFLPPAWKLLQGCPGLPPPQPRPRDPREPRPGLHLGCQAPAGWAWVSGGGLVSKPALPFLLRGSPPGVSLRGGAAALQDSSHVLPPPSPAPPEPPAPLEAGTQHGGGCRYSTGGGPQKRRRRSCWMAHSWGLVEKGMLMGRANAKEAGVVWDALAVVMAGGSDPRGQTFQDQRRSRWGVTGSSGPRTDQRSHSRTEAACCSRALLPPQARGLVRGKGSECPRSPGALSRGDTSGLC